MSTFAGKTAGRICYACDSDDCRVAIFSSGRRGNDTCPSCLHTGRRIRGATSEHNTAITLAKAERGKQDSPKSDVP